MTREFYVVIERDEDGMFVGEVPQLRACYTQGRTLDELLQNIHEVIKLCLEEYNISDFFPEFVGVQKVVV
ncbi:MAG: type II toxin-antitoxin system HicB family antitoxin [Chloroflexi bacterium]|nr:type II toxin-antitoxin system HicB family antitoxin [Chloroflexota bacterium]